MRLLDTYEPVNADVIAQVWEQVDSTTFTMKGVAVLISALPQNYTRENVKAALSCDGDWE